MNLNSCVVIEVEVAAADGVSTMNGVMVVDGVWVQWCWMRACTNPQSR